MPAKLLEPVFNDKGEAYWLTWRPGIGNEPLSVFEIERQGIWICQKCHARIYSNPEPPTICPTEDRGCGRPSTFKPYTQIVNPDLWQFPKWQDLNIDPKQLYEENLALTKRVLVFPEEINYKIFNLWIMSTWKLESWESVGFPSFIGLIDSGKSKALDVIRELGWRTIHSSGVTFPAMVRATDAYQATILIDEAHNKLRSDTEKGQELIDFIKPSYRRGSKYIIANKEDPTQKQIVSFNNFGFKAFAGERGFDKALTSRTITFEMEQDYPAIQKLSLLNDAFEQQRTKLLNYRYKTDAPPELPPECPLKGRTLEIFESIIRTGYHIGIEVYDLIEHAESVKKGQIEDLQNSDEYQILAAIKGNEENEKLFDAPEYVTYRDLLARLGWDSDPKKPQYMGNIISRRLRLKSKRMNDGTVLPLTDTHNSKKLQYLYRRYAL